MQAQSSQEQFEHSITRIRSNLSYIRPTNIKMKEDVELYRRKLNASYSAGFLRQTEYVSQPNCEIIENDRNLGNIPRSLKTNVIFSSKGELATTSIQPRVVSGLAPTQTGNVVTHLSSELSESNKEIHYLKKIISNNEEGSRIIIANLQSQIHTLRMQNQQLRNGQQRLIGELNYFRGGPNKFGDCQKCHTLEERIRQLQGYLNELNGKYEMERQRNAANSSDIIPNVIEKLQLVEERLAKMTIETQQLQGQNMRLKQENWQLRQKDFNSLEEHNRLITQIQQKINDFQATQNRYKRQVFELEREIERLNVNQSPTKFGKEQLLIENQQIVQELRRERDLNEELKKKLVNGQTLRSELSQRLSQAEHYISNEVAANLKRQSEHIESLVTNSASLEFELNRNKKRVEELETLLQNENLRYSTLQQQKNGYYSELLTVKIQNSELSHELSLNKIERNQIEAEKEQILLKFRSVEKQLISNQTQFTNEINRITAINEELSQKYQQISRLVGSKQDQSNLLEETKLQQRKFFDMQLKSTVAYYEDKLNDVSVELRKQIQSMYMLKQSELQYSIELLRQQIRKDQEVQTELMNRNKQLQNRVQTIIDQSPPSPQKNQYILQIANEQLTNEINTLRSNNEELSNRLVQAENYITLQTAQLQQFFIREQSLNLNVVQLSEEKDRLQWQLQKLNEQLHGQGLQKTVLMMDIDVKDRRFEEILQENLQNKNAKINLQAELSLKRKECLQVQAKILELNKQLLLKDQKIADLQNRSKSPVKQAVQNQSEDNVVSIDQLTLKLAQIEQQYTVKQQQKESLQNSIKELENAHKAVFEQAEFFKAKLIQAEVYIDVLTRERDQLRQQIQQLSSIRQRRQSSVDQQIVGKDQYLGDKITQDRSETDFWRSKLEQAEQFIIHLQSEMQSKNQLIIRANSVPSLSSVSPLQQQNVVLQQQIVRLQQQIDKLNVQKTKTSSIHQEFKLLITKLQQQLMTYQLKIIDEDQQIKSLMTQKDTYLERVLDYDAYIKVLKQDIRQLNNQYTATQQKTALMTPRVKIFQLEKTVAEMAKEASFFKNQLMQAEAYIIKLQNEKLEGGIEVPRTIQQSDVVRENEALKSQIIMAQNQISRLILQDNQKEQEIRRMHIVIEQIVIKLETTQKELQKVQSQFVTFRRQLGYTANSSPSVQMQHREPSTAASIQSSITQQNESLKLTLSQIRNDFVRLQKEKRDALQRLQQNESMIKGLENNIVTFTRQVKDSQNKVRVLESDKRNAEQKVKQTTESVKTIEMRLQEFKIKAKQAEDKIIKLSEENGVVGQKHGRLDEITREAEILRNNLTEAERYITYMEGLKINGSQPIPTDGVHQIQNLRIELQRLEYVNRSLESQKTQATIQLQKNVEIVKVLQFNLDSQKTKLKLAEDHIVILQNQKQVAEAKLCESHKLLQESNNQTTFYKEKLIEAEEYIAYLDSQKIEEGQPEGKALPEDHQKSWLQNRVVVLEEQKRLLQELRHNASIESLKRETLLKDLQQSTVDLSKRVSEAEGRATKLREQNKAGEQLKLMSVLQNNLKDAQVKLSTLQRQNKNQVQEIQFFKNKLLDAQNYITEMQGITSRLEKVVPHPHENWQEKISVLEYQIKNIQKERKTLQDKLVPNEKRVEVLTAQVDFFKKKLLKAEQYITHLEQTSQTTEQFIQITVNEGHNQIIAKNSNEFVSKIISELKQARNNLQLITINADIRDQHNKQVISVLTAELQKLKNDDVKILGRPIETKEKDVNTNIAPKQIEFFEQKLLQAESYISELQIQNSEGGLIVQRLQEKLQVIINDFNNVNDKLIKQQAEKSVLLGKTKELSVVNQKLKGELQSLKELPPYDPEKVQLKSLILSLQRDLQNQKQKAVQNKRIIDQKQSVEFLKSKLHEAEVYIFELEQKAEPLNIAIASLQNEIATLKRELQQVNAKFARVSQQKISCLSDMQKLKSEYENLKSKVGRTPSKEAGKTSPDAKTPSKQTSRTPSHEAGRTLSQEVLILTEKIYALQEQLQVQNKLHLQEVIQLNNHIDELKQFQQSKNAAIDEVISGNKIKLSKLQDENIRLKEQLCLSKTEVTNLTEDLIQVEADREYLRHQNEEITDINIQLKEDRVGGRSGQLQDLKKELQNQLVIYRKDVEELRNRIRERESEITELYRERNNAEKQLRELKTLVQKLQTMISSLEKQIHAKNEKIDELQTDNERLQKVDGDQFEPEEQSAQFFKEKLLQAESYITELEHQNQIYSNQRQTLRQDLKMRYQEELQNMAEKLGEVEQDRIKLYKIVKEQQRQLEIKGKHEGTEPKDFKNENVQIIQTITVVQSDREVVIKSLQEDKISLQRRVEEYQSVVNKLHHQLTNERQANGRLIQTCDRLGAQSKVITDTNYQLLQEKQVSDRQIDGLNARIEELTWLLQQRQEQPQDSIKLKSKAAQKNYRNQPQLLEQPFEYSIQEDSDLRKQLTRQIESLTVELQKKDEEYIELSMQKLNSQQQKRYLQSKLQSREALHEDELKLQRQKQALILQLKGDKHRLIERLQAIESQKSILAHELNRLTLNHREAEYKLYQQNSRIEQLEQRLSDESQQLTEEVIKGGVRRLIDFTNSYSQQEEEHQNVIVRELQPFPYLQELVNSIFQRLKIAQLRQDAKNQQIQSLNEELDALRSTPLFNEGQDSSPPRLQRDRDDLQELRQQMQSDREQKVNELQVQMDNLQWSQRELKNKLQQNESERVQLTNQLREAYRRIEQLSRAESVIRREQQQLVIQNQLLYSNLSAAQNRIVNLQSSQTSCIREQQLGETIRKIIDLTNNYSEQTEEQVFPELESFPYLSELINSILYRLKLSSAIDVEKSLKLDRLNQEGEEIKWKMDELKKENDSLKQNNSDVLAQLVQREAQNQELSDRVNDISDQLEKQNQQIRVLERELASKRPSLDSDTSSSVKDRLYLDFLNGCLVQISTMEQDVQEVERDIERVANAQFVYRSSRSENSTLLEQLKELEDRVRTNAVTLHRQQERADTELVTLLTELKQNKSLPQVDKNKISGYLSQLQHSLIGEHEQHQSELSRINQELSASNATSGQVRVSSMGDEDVMYVASREELLKQINSLNSAIEIYHQETMRRKEDYTRTIDGLLRDLVDLKDKYNELNEQSGDDDISLRINDIGLKMKLALQNQENEEFNRSGEDEDEYDIVNGYYTQFLSEDKEKKERLCAISRLNLENPNLSNTQVQTDSEPKPFLEYVLNSRDLDKQDILLLKRKISEMRSRQVDENMRLLRVQEGRLQEIIIQTNGESTPHQIDNIILTLANNRTPEEISQIFESENNDDILKKLNDALYLEDAFVRGQNPAILLRLMEECMLRYYEKPTKLSEEVYAHLISVLVAKTEEQLYAEVDGLFRDLHGIESEFESALRKKDQVYRLHNERMNKIFNRSSSDVSEDYLSGLQGQVEEIEMHLSSGHKYRGSDLDSYHVKQ